MPLLPYVHPEYSWSQLGEVPVEFWVRLFAVVGYNSFSLTTFEREAPVARGC